jgi:multicomponent Na+:H+ antiporter subunit G
VTASDALSVALLVFGVATILLCSLGVLVLRDALVRLHCVGLATSLAPLAIAAAVVIDRSPSQAGIKAILVYRLLLLIGSVLTHATGRAIYLRRQMGERS